MLRTTRFLVVGLSLAIAPCFCLDVSAATVNGFANGGFEDPAAPGPSATSWLPADAGYSRSNDALSGTYSLQLSSPATNAQTALQNSIEQGGLPPLTVGDTPQLSFWAKGTVGTTGVAQYEFRYLDGIGNILANSGAQNITLNPNTWTENTFNLGAVPAGATAAFLLLKHAIGPINGVDLLPGTVLIDDVYLGVAAPPIPEPATLVMAGLAGLALVGLRRKK